MHIDINDNDFIINELTSGNEEVFDMVYRYYFRRLCGFCAQYIKEQDEIEEIVQNTMLWLWENRESLLLDHSLKSLLFTIVKNKAINRISHFEIRRKVHQEIYEKYQEEFEKPDFYLNNEIFKLYDNAFDQLPDKYKEAFDLNRNNNMTHSEIAAKLGVSPQTINYRISQALKLLRIALKDYLIIGIFLQFYFF